MNSMIRQNTALRLIQKIKEEHKKQSDLYYTMLDRLEGFVEHKDMYIAIPSVWHGCKYGKHDAEESERFRKDAIHETLRSLDLVKEDHKKINEYILYLIDKIERRR